VIYCFILDTASFFVFFPLAALFTAFAFSLISAAATPMTSNALFSAPNRLRQFGALCQRALGFAPVEWPRPAPVFSGLWAEGREAEAAQQLATGERPVDLSKLLKGRALLFAHCQDRNDEHLRGREAWIVSARGAQLWVSAHRWEKTAPQKHLADSGWCPSPIKATLEEITATLSRRSFAGALAHALRQWEAGVEAATWSEGDRRATQETHPSSEYSGHWTQTGRAGVARTFQLVGPERSRLKGLEGRDIVFAHCQDCWRDAGWSKESWVVLSQGGAFFFDHQRWGPGASESRTSVGFQPAPESPAFAPEPATVSQILAATQKQMFGSRVQALLESWQLAEAVRSAQPAPLASRSSAVADPKGNLSESRDSGVALTDSAEAAPRRARRL